MNSNFDYEFEQTRLNMLKNQCLLNLNISGKIIFRSMDGGNRIDSAKFILTDEAFEKINSSGLKQLLMSLLDDLAEYRSSHNIYPFNAGCLNIIQNNMSIVWLEQSEILHHFPQA